ncbi:MAG: EexN family lipoprotein [Acidisphaera sp.]|nr:EexN family lipoprotein [Acidisphaera sp.]
MWKTSGTYLLAALLVGGSVASARATDANDRHTVSWYIGHLQEMMKELDQCRDDPGDARNDPNCINAEEAKMKNDALQILLGTNAGNMEMPSYWAGDRILRDGVLGQCANPIPNYRFNPSSAICAAAQQAKDAVGR